MHTKIINNKTHTYVRTYIHTYTHEYIRTYTHIYKHVHTYIHTCVHTHITIYALLITQLSGNNEILLEIITQGKPLKEFFARNQLHVINEEVVKTFQRSKFSSIKHLTNMNNQIQAAIKI